MKKYSVLLVSAAVLVSSCTTGTGAGAYMGSSFGSILGSAIGGITGGPRGSDVGTIIGMASGAIVGAAVGNAADKQQQEDQSEILARRNQRIQRQKANAQARRHYSDDSFGQDNVYGPQSQSYDYAQPQSQDEAAEDVDPTQMVDTTNSSDDRINFDVSSGNDAYAADSDVVAAPGTSVSADRLAEADASRLEIRNARFTDDGGDGVLQAGETGKVTFEIFNHSDRPTRNIVPTVVEADANRYIYISPSILVEEIAPGQGIRYTATVKADRRLKADGIRFLVSAVRNGQPASYITVVKVATARK